MKDVILNDETYNGVSAINVPAADGTVAKFRDVDEFAGGFEVQTTKCDTTIGTYGGIRFMHTGLSGEASIYAGVPDIQPSLPGSSAMTTRFPWAFIVVVKPDETVVALTCGWNADGKATVELADGHITLTGTSGNIMVGTDAVFAIYKLK